jgi:uncharacterized membrane protein YfcA
MNMEADMDASTLVAFLSWGLVVGVVFSAIGAAGGILTSFGLITIFSIMEPNSVKPMTQIVVLATTLFLVPGYLRRSALIVPLGLLLGGGGLIGGYVGSTLSSVYLSDMQTFQPLFGILTLVVASQIIGQFFRRRHSRADGVEIEEEQSNVGVSQTSLTFRALTFHYGEKDYHLPLWSPIVAGMAIATTASIFGVGGGFLLVPYLTVVLAIPMHVVPATAAIAIFMSLIVSISNFVALGPPLHLDILIPLTAGAIIGAIVGPNINRVSKNHWLQSAVGVVVIAIGLKYTLF